MLSTSPQCSSSRGCSASGWREGPARRRSHPRPTCCSKPSQRRPPSPGWDRSSRNLTVEHYFYAMRLTLQFTVFDLRMTKVKILAGSGRIVASSCWFFDLLQFDPHVVDVGVDGYQIHVAVLLWSCPLIDGIPPGLPLVPVEGSVSLEENVWGQQWQLSWRSGRPCWSTGSSVSLRSRGSIGSYKVTTNVKLYFKMNYQQFPHPSVRLVLLVQVVRGDLQHPSFPLVQ